MDGIAEKDCFYGFLADRTHTGVVRPVENNGFVEYCCETCAPIAEKENADLLAWKADRSVNPLSEDELRAAVQALGDLTGSQIQEISSRQIRDKEASAAQKQIWWQVLDDHNRKVRIRGEALLRDLVIGARYRVRYWDPDKIPARGRASLNLTANAISAGMAAIENAADSIRGDVITGELRRKHWNIVNFTVTHRGILGSKAYDVPIYTSYIGSIEPA